MRRRPLRSAHQKLARAERLHLHLELHDSLKEPSPPPTRVNTEIDLEMPAHVPSPPPWSMWATTLGFNTWSHTDADADATYINYPYPSVNPFDGRFHLFRWDWHDGTNLELCTLVVLVLLAEAVSKLRL
jgi:hypothetical protein